MYSPQIRDDLIPQIYQVAKKAGLAMTVWVSRVIEQALSENGKSEGQEIKTEIFERRKDNHDPARV